MTDEHGGRLDSDIIGDQIGEAVGRLLEPRVVMEGMVGDVLRTKLFANVARKAVDVALILGWKPEYMYTVDYHDKMLDASLRMYLDRFGEEAGFNSMRVQSLGKEYVVRSSSYKEGDKERMGDWDKQVAYARKFMKERTSEEKLRFGLTEAVNIVELDKVLQATRDRVAKRNNITV